MFLLVALGALVFCVWVAVGVGALAAFGAHSTGGTILGVILTIIFILAPIAAAGVAYYVATLAMSLD